MATRLFPPWCPTRTLWVSIPRAVKGMWLTLRRASCHVEPPNVFHKILCIVPCRSWWQIWFWIAGACHTIWKIWKVTPVNVQKSGINHGMFHGIMVISFRCVSRISPRAAAWKGRRLQERMGTKAPTTKNYKLDKFVCQISPPPNTKHPQPPSNRSSPNM